MKKLILALAVLSLFTVEIIEAAWYTQARYYNYRPSTSSSRNYRNYVPRTTSTFRSRNYRNYRHRTTSTFKRTNRRVSPRTYLYSRTKRTTSTEQLTVKVAPVRSLNAITSVYDDPAKIFEINVSNPGLRSSQLYTEAIKLTDLEFKMFGNTGVAANPRNFQLVVNDESFNFDRNGKVNLSFKNARLARGENIDLDIYLKFKEPDTTPNISGSMQIRVTGATAQKEQSRLAAKTSISGNSSSRIIRIDPTATVSTGYSSGVVSGFTSAISGRTLMTGEKAVVLGLNLNAYYDDLKIEKITVADSLSGGNIDSFVRKISAINLDTGHVYGDSRFIGGEAKFTFNSGIRINRGSQVRLGFLVEIADTIKNTNASYSFKLDVEESDITVYGTGAGRYLSNSDKNISVNADTFIVAGGAVRFYVLDSQPTLVSIGSLQHAFKFKITNPGDKSISIGRVSMNVNMGGVEFPGGFSSDDAEIREIVNGREVGGTNFTVSRNGTKLIFDTKTELYISRNTTKEFVLKLKLEDLPGNLSGDYVSVSILSDSSDGYSTLSSHRSSGKNLIWSDHSARPHYLHSDDWTSGYLLPGLPTNTEVIKR